MSELISKKLQVAELEFHRSRGWAYKWLKRYSNDCMWGLKDRLHSGRHADVPVEKLLEVRKELSENPSGWKVKQITNIIYERTGGINRVRKLYQGRVALARSVFFLYSKN